MNDEAEKRWKEVAEYIVKENATIRQAAKKFGVSKSTIHKDVVVMLPTVNAKLAEKARKVLDTNKAERSIRGGAATRKKYQMIKEEKSKNEG